MWFLLEFGWEWKVDVVLKWRISAAISLQWARMSIMTSQFARQYNICSEVFQADTKETSNSVVTGPLLGESTGHWWISLTKGEKPFHILTSPWVAKSCLRSLLLIWINFNPIMDKYVHQLKSVGRNYLSIPKLPWCSRWSLWMEKEFIP